MDKWWPRWEGDDVVIVASGPSAKDVNLAAARGKARFITINSSWRLAPWAEIIYGCDGKWWRRYFGEVKDTGATLLTSDRRTAREMGLPYVRTQKPDDRIIMEPKGTVGWGGNSGFHALNLALQFQCRRVVLVGFDMQIAGGSHWHGDHPEGMHNPSKGNIARWRGAVDGAAGVAANLGAEVLNCSPVSALKNYPKVDFEEVFA